MCARIDQQQPPFALPKPFFVRLACQIEVAAKSAKHVKPCDIPSEQERVRYHSLSYAGNETIERGYLFLLLRTYQQDIKKTHTRITHIFEKKSNITDLYQPPSAMAVRLRCLDGDDNRADAHWSQRLSAKNYRFMITGSNK